MRTETLEQPVLPWTSAPWHVAQEAVLTTCRHMLDAVRAGREADTSASDNLKTFALVEAAYEAAATEASSARRGLKCNAGRPMKAIRPKILCITGIQLSRVQELLTLVRDNAASRARRGRLQPFRRPGAARRRLTW